MTVLLADGAVDISIDLGERLGVDDADLTPATLAKLRPIFRELVRSWREELLDVWPVLTGRSQSSWTDRWEGLVWVLRNPVEYAEFVHRKDDPTQVWSYLEAHSEELLDAALPEIQEIIDAQKAEDRSLGGRTRSLIASAARALGIRQVGVRVFQAQAMRFQAVSSLERTKRQLKRFAA